ncbi:putative lipoprotein [Rhizobium azibense]|nr:putative lipoprotein [Rhizobium azibense]
MLRMKGALLAALVAAALPGCKIIKTPTAEEKAAAAAKTAFDPNARVEAIWQSQVVPYFEKRAGELKEVLQLATSSPDQAGGRYGNPRKQSSSPWTYAVKFTGKVIAADTASRAATLDVDADGDGKADAKVQIGPALRGTALRDTLDFVNFNEFKNQIEWAQFGKAFNEKANTAFLSAIPRDGLAGKTVTVIGAFPLPNSGQLPLVTPCQLTVAS